MGSPLLDTYLRSQPSVPRLSGGRERVFPTRHPMGEGDLSRSNVLMAGVNLSGREYVVPTMVDGKKLPIKEAVGVARANGISNYPSFDSPEASTEFAQREHGNVGEDGFLKPKPRPSIVAEALRRNRSPLLR